MTNSKSSRAVFYDVQDGRDELSRLYDRDHERYRAAYVSDVSKADHVQISSKMMFSAHSVEKSLSNEKFETGRAFWTVKQLVKLMNLYSRKGYDRSHYSYQNVLSVLKEFYSKHKNTEYEDEIERILSSVLDEIKHTTSTIGGAKTISSIGKRNNNRKNFKELAEGRFAVRSYADTPVDKSDIEDAVTIALKSPTVCNRQPVRVRAIYNKDLIAKVLEVQGGIVHYDTPPVLLLITSDDSNYVDINERNQGYIDGGLFAMSILYALEYKGLAACPLHAMFETERDFKVRGLLGIPDSEKLITFISAGHFREETGVCKSFRYPIGQVLTEVDSLKDFSIEVIKKGPTVNQAHGVTGAPKVGRLDSIRKKVRMRTRVKSAISRLYGRYKVSYYAKFDGAILTLPGYYNYGNVIQRYALQKFLKNNGLNFVSYVHSKVRNQGTIYRHPMMVYVKAPLRFMRRLLRGQKPYWFFPLLSDRYKEIKQEINLVNFVNKYIKVKNFDVKDRYRTYIVGSDQVWRKWRNDRDMLGYYFFNFLKGRKANRIAYAASFGKSKVADVMSDDDMKYIQPYIEEFDSVSVRESSAIDAVETTWGVRDVAGVVDPTLLLNQSDYSYLINCSEVRDVEIPALYAYVLDASLEVEDFIQRVGSRYGADVMRIGAHSSADEKPLPSVELWLKGFRDAELVVTNSFHGMMFSIINNRDFIVIGREDGGLPRIVDFMNDYGIDGRLVMEDELETFNLNHIKPLNWKAINKIREERRLYSGDWLLSAIRKNKL